MEYKNLQIDCFKSDFETGIIEGYASTFGNTDLVNDVVLKGAFIDSIKQNKIRLLWQHDPSQPIGITEAREDEKGLFVKNQINLEVQKGREALALLKQGAIDSFSIGYQVQEKQYNGDIRELKKINLKEVSLVTFPANEQAVITSVKSVRSEIKNIRDFESFLRDSGFSKKEAVAIASKGFKVLQSDSELNDEELLIKFYTELEKKLK